MVDQSSDSRDNPGPDEIPQPEAIELPVRNSALVIVDMQNDFVQATGKIYTGSMVNATVPRIRELLDRARQAQMKVIHTQSWYERDDPRFTDHAKARFYKGGCMAGTWGAELINELKPLDKEPVVRKASYDCWYGTNMELVLKAMKFGEFEPGSVHRNRERNNFNVVITGTVSNVCVEKAVIGFYLRGFDVFVPVDCVSAKNTYAQEWALRQFVDFYRAKITRSDLITLRATDAIVEKAYVAP